MCSPNILYREITAAQEDLRGEVTVLSFVTITWLKGLVFQFLETVNSSSGEGAFCASRYRQTNIRKCNAANVY